MSGRGGHRAGSGRIKIHEGKAAAIRQWQKGHRRIWVENILYSSWLSARLKCGYQSDSAVSLSVTFSAWSYGEGKCVQTVIQLVKKILLLMLHRHTFIFSVKHYYL